MTERAPRILHPGAWWTWALLVAAAASTTTNPVALVLLAAATCTVVAARRTSAPWALAFRQYLVVAAIILVLRIVMRLLFAGGSDLAQAAYGGAVDGLRLGVLVVCVGAANALASPRRLLASLPPALHEAGTAVVIALSVFPQLAESARRVHRARILRGDAGRWRTLHQVAVPVLEDAFDRSLTLAAAMDARGYGRSGSATARERRLSAATLLAGLAGIVIGMYALLDATITRTVALSMLAAGLTLAACGIQAAGRRVQRTHYRRQRWHGAEAAVACSGAAALGAMLLLVRTDPTALHPDPGALALPPLPHLALTSALLALLPALLAPPPPGDAP